MALPIGLVALRELAGLEQRSAEIHSEALVPSMQLAEIRRAYLQTRVDALADELLPKGPQDVEHQDNQPTQHPAERADNEREQGDG